MKVELFSVIKKIMAVHNVDVTCFREPFDFTGVDLGLRKLFDKNFEWEKIVKIYSAGFSENILYIVEDILGIYYALFITGGEQKEVMLAGPFLYTGTGFDPQSYRSRGYTEKETEMIKEQLLRTPHIHEDVITHHLAAVLSVAIDGEVDIKNIKEHRTNSINDNRFSFVYTEASEKAPMSLVEQRYAIENEILRAVAMGNLTRARRSFEHLMGTDIAERYSPTIQTQKKTLIIMNTLFRKSIEQAGVHPYYIDELSYRFFQKIDLVTNRREQAALLNEMLTEYCEYAKMYSVEKYSPIVQEAINCIHLNIANSISLREIAQTLEISTSHLARSFSRETGKSVVEYINYTRMRIAANRIKQGRETVADIAASVGISDTNYFSRLFRKYIGCSPSEYRRQQ